MPREPKVTLTLTESNARYLHWLLSDGRHGMRDTEDIMRPSEIADAIQHALAECGCGRAS